MTSPFLFVVAGAALLYAGTLGVLWWLQEHVVFQPPSPPPDAPIAARRVQYEARDGVRLFAYVVGDCRSDSTVVLAFHGNADLARWYVPWASRVVAETGACVVVPEYRGYDGLHPFPSYASSAVDARAALDYVRETLHVSSSRTVLFGHSLGSAIAAELADAATPKSLVLQSPFSSARAMARRMFIPGVALFWRVISRVHFDTVDRVSTMDVPVWVAHGDRDMVIPVRMGREVFDAAAHKGHLLIVPRAGHNDVAEVGGRAYWDWLRRAIHGDAAIDSPAAGRRSAL